MNEREAIILGALLHDIGKFVQRAQEKPNLQDHPHWGGTRKLPRAFTEQGVAMLSSVLILMQFVN